VAQVVERKFVIPASRSSDSQLILIHWKGVPVRLLCSAWQNT
jgi:hypothetical protein